MKTRLNQSAFLLVALFLLPLLATAQDVFEQADEFRQALIEKDMGRITSLDKDGEILTEDGIKFLFDHREMSGVGSGMRPLRDIVAAATRPPLVERHILDGEPVYYVYWYVPSADGAVRLDAGQWMKTIAVCALRQASDGAWVFHQHLCFDETEGPFLSGDSQ